MKPQINTNVESFLLVYLFVLLIDLYEGIINKHLLSCSTDFFCQVNPPPPVPNRQYWLAFNMFLWSSS